MTSIPTREDFKWFYALLLKRKVVDLQKELQSILAFKRWTKDKLVFMSKVFFELEFVNIENGIITLNPKPIKKDLADSLTYKQKINEALIEQTLYYSTYSELLNWFKQHITHMDTREEEAVYGL